MFFDKELVYMNGGANHAVEYIYMNGAANRALEDMYMNGGASATPIHFCIPTCLGGLRVLLHVVNI